MFPSVVAWKDWCNSIPVTTDTASLCYTKSLSMAANSIDTVSLCCSILPYINIDIKQMPPGNFLVHFLLPCYQIAYVCHCIYTSGMNKITSFELTIKIKCSQWADIWLYQITVGTHFARLFLLRSVCVFHHGFPTATCVDASVFQGRIQPLLGTYRCGMSRWLEAMSLFFWYYWLYLERHRIKNDWAS